MAAAAQANGEPEMDMSLSYAEGEPSPWPSKSKWQLFTDGFNVNPDGPAIIAMHQSPDHLSELIADEKETNGQPSGNKEAHLSWSYRQLRSAAEKFASALSVDVYPGDVCVAVVPNCVEYALYYWAVARAGAIFCALDPSLLARPDELRKILRLINPRAIVVEDVEQAGNVDKIGSTLCLKLLIRGEADASGWSNLLRFILDRDPTVPTIPESETAADLDKTVDIIFTSGTTGVPKACPLTHKTFSYQSQELATLTRTEVGAKALLYTATFRAILPCSCVCSWANGGTVVFPSAAFNPRSALQALIKLGCTLLPIVPGYLQAFAKQPDLLEIVAKQNTAKVAVVGGDITSLQLVERTHDIIHPRNVIPMFGMSEGTSFFSWGGEDIGTIDKPLPVTDGSIVGLGRVRPGGKVRVCKPGTQTPLKRGEIGALHVNGPSLIQRYLGNRDAESFYSDDKGRWFITGDLALMDKDGVMFVMGRTKDIIKRKGVGLSPAVIENCLNRHPGVESCVIGYPHAEYGQVPVGIIRSQESGSSMKAELKERSIRELGVDSEVEDVLTLGDLNLTSFPINSSGKVAKRDLLQVVEKYYETQPGQ